LALSESTPAAHMPFEVNCFTLAPFAVGTA